MKKQNIYQNQSQELLSLFEAAGSSAKVMCVPMHWARRNQHIVVWVSTGLPFFLSLPRWWMRVILQVVNIGVRRICPV